jgi:hypothetical protein
MWLGFCAHAVGPVHAQDAAALAPFDAARTYRVLRLEGNSVRWQKPADGTGLVLTYRLIGDSEQFPGARNCGKMASLEPLLARSGVAVASFRAELAAAFAMWEAVADLTFREAREGARADIMIGAQLQPEGWAFADVVHDRASPERIKPILRALICLNPLRRWKIGFDGNLKAYDLRYTLAHEIGHAIGLDHPAAAGEVMGFRYEERFRTLQLGDVKGAVALYGKRARPGAAVASDRDRGAKPGSADSLDPHWDTRAFTAPPYWARRSQSGR